MADAAELAIDLLSGRLPVGQIPVAGSAFGRAANFDDYNNYLKFGFGTSSTTKYVNTMQGVQVYLYGQDAYNQ